MAKSAGKSKAASKKASKSKARKLRPVDETQDPPIIIKGGPLALLADSAGEAMLMGGQEPMNFNYLPDEEVSAVYNYPTEVIGTIFKIVVYKDNQMVLDESVLNSTWEIQLHTVHE